MNKKKKTIKITLEVELPNCSKSNLDSGLVIPKKEYFHCVIGPTSRNEFPPCNGESTLRRAVIDAFYKLVGYNAEICSSGWGYSKEQYNADFRLGLKINEATLKEYKKKKK